MRNLERLVTWGGLIGRKKRKAFNKFPEHPDPHIRRYAEELAVRDKETRALLRSLVESGYCEPEGDYFEFEGTAVGENPQDLSSQDEINAPDDDDIPF
jgi:hypothetical protein